MSALAKILLYLIVVVLLAAVLSPPIYWAMQWLGGQGVLTWLAGFPFHRYFSRVAQVSAIVLLVPLLWWLRIRSFSEFGLVKNPRGWRDGVAGLIFGLAPVVLLGAGYVLFDVYRLKEEFLVAILFRIAVTAVFVAVAEEFLFRGVMLGLAARAFGRWPAALGVSLVFAGVHFLKPGKQMEPVVAWWTGLAQIPRVLDAAPPPGLFALGFLSLFVAGLVLALAALRTQSLWLPVGLHAGWIFGQQILQWLAKYRVKPPEALLPWVGPNVVSGAVPTGLVSLAVLLLTGVAVWLYVRNAPAHPRGS